MAVPRSLRLYLSVALGLVFVSVAYLYHADSYGRRGDASPPKPKHVLESAEDPILVFPHDPLPRRDFASLATYPAQNIHEPSRFAFATLYCTRIPDTRGPYFEATQSLIWRLLWSDFRSRYPIIVYVCPFIPEENRRILRGQGALVKEIELLDDIIPDEVIKTKRWIDVLSKLNLWKEVEWKRLVFLDSDALPIKNIDEIFDLVPEQRCKKEALSLEDQALSDQSAQGEDLCDYAYAGVPQYEVSNINAGMLLLKPNLAMHAKLIKAARSIQDYKIEDMEQGVLKSKNAFAYDGPFPVHRLPDMWNALPEYYTRYIAEGLEATEGPVRVLHSKMWNRMWGEWNNFTHLNDMWDLDWMKMCRFFDSPEFALARKSGVFKSAWELHLENQKSE